MKKKISKPRGNIISNVKARQIAMEWYQGQWSSFYQFGSSGVYMDENYERYMREVESNIPYAKTMRGEATKLNALKKYFEYKHWEANS